MGVEREDRGHVRMSFGDSVDVKDMQWGTFKDNLGAVLLEVWSPCQQQANSQAQPSL